MTDKLDDADVLVTGGTSGIGAAMVPVEPLVSHRCAGADFMAAFGAASKPDEAAKVLVKYHQE